MPLTQQERGLLGASKNREVALEKYYENPNYCKECNKLIEVGEHQKVCEVKQKQFCSRSCAASFNGRAYPKRVPLNKYGPCEECGERIYYRRQKAGGYTKRRFCETCLSIIRSNTSGRASEYCLICKEPIEGQRKYCSECLSEALSSGAKNGKHESPLLKCTIRELKQRRKSYWSWRVEITTKARKAYLNSDQPKACFLCGYDKHFDVCHKEDVSSFSDETTLAEVNKLENLVALCKNCHWELDHGLLSKEDENKIMRV